MAGVSALLLVFMSGIGYSLQSLIVKLLAEKHGFTSSCQLVLVRGLVQTTLCLLIRWHLPPPPGTSALSLYQQEDAQKVSTRLLGDTWKVTGLLWLRGVLGYGGIALSFLSLEYIPIGDSVTLLMMSPFYAAILSYFVLGEPWLFVEYIGAIISFVGVVLVSRPPSLFRFLSLDDGRGALAPGEVHNVHLGLVCALLAGICAGASYCTIRVLGTTSKMPWTSVAFAQGVPQALFAVPTAYIIKQDLQLGINPTLWLVIVGTAVLGSCSQFCMTIGMQQEKSARATLMRMSDIVGAFCWQALFTRDSVNAFSAAGAALVCAGVILVVVLKNNSSEGGDDSSAIVNLMKQVEMQVADSSLKNQKYSKLEHDDDQDDDDYDLDDMMADLNMTDKEMKFLEILESQDGSD